MTLRDAAWRCVSIRACMSCFRFAFCRNYYYSYSNERYARAEPKRDAACLGGARCDVMRCHAVSCGVAGFCNPSTDNTLISYVWFFLAFFLFLSLFLKQTNSNNNHEVLYYMLTIVNIWAFESLWPRSSLVAAKFSTSRSPDALGSSPASASKAGDLKWPRTPFNDPSKSFKISWKPVQKGY